MKKRLFSGILVLSLMLALASCGLLPTPNPTEPTEPTEPEADKLDVIITKLDEILAKLEG